ncbi:hypothetical protein JKP88DRAFT_287579 [Tribonema minus]|uniref:Uncharacterized protein n=1 Tax=Tribonema minus TaxID=303371 RepID=A0A836CK50_9STRA|nr:hypothetical protein JKP88DRAFT_287579 [Tribonema minus]
MQLANEQAARHQARVDELSRHGSTDDGSSDSLDDAQQQAARYQARAQAAAAFLASTQHGSATDMALATSTAAAEMAAAVKPAASAAAAAAAEPSAHEHGPDTVNSVLQGDAADSLTPTSTGDEPVIPEAALHTFTDFANLGQNTTAAIAYFRKIGAASRANALEEAVADLHQMEAEVNQLRGEEALSTDKELQLQVADRARERKALLHIRAYGQLQEVKEDVEDAQEWEQLEHDLATAQKRIAKMRASLIRHLFRFTSQLLLAKASSRAAAESLVLIQFLLERRFRRCTGLAPMRDRIPFRLLFSEWLSEDAVEIAMARPTPIKEASWPAFVFIVLLEVSMKLKHYDDSGKLDPPEAFWSVAGTLTNGLMARQCAAAAASKGQLIADALQQWRREIGTAAYLSHENIEQLHTHVFNQEMLEAESERRHILYPQLFNGDLQRFLVVAVPIDTAPAAPAGGAALSVAAAVLSLRTAADTAAASGAAAASAAAASTASVSTPAAAAAAPLLDAIAAAVSSAGTGMPAALLLLAALQAAHEAGHAAVALAQRMKVHWPPRPLPLGPFGTFGTLLRPASVPPDASALFDFAAAGPTAGALASLVMLVAGLQGSILTAFLPVWAYVMGRPWSRVADEQSSAGTARMIAAAAVQVFWLGVLLPMPLHSFLE